MPASKQKCIDTFNQSETDSEPYHGIPRHENLRQQCDMGILLRNSAWKYSTISMTPSAFIRSFKSCNPI